MPEDALESLPEPIIGCPAWQEHMLQRGRTLFNAQQFSPCPKDPIRPMSEGSPRASSGSLKGFEAHGAAIRLDVSPQR